MTYPHHPACLPGAQSYEQLRASNAKLERQVANVRMDLSYWKERFEQAEQRIAESQRQEPFAWIDTMQAELFRCGLGDSTRLEKVSGYKMFPLYTNPIIQPTVEEALRDLVTQIRVNAREMRNGKLRAEDAVKNIECAADAIRARSGK